MQAMQQGTVPAEAWDTEDLDSSSVSQDVE
jgi:hypothetical protein